MPPHRYVFVGGLHRSGTSLVARRIARLPGVAGIAGAPVPEQEGAYLTGAIPHSARHGRPMHFATDPAQRHTEGGPYDRAEVRDRIEADWAPWFAPAAWRVEKSPVNLLRLRLYQGLFPLSQAVVVLRHPQAVAAAVAKWVEGPADALVDHWIAAHEGVWRDLPHLHAVMVLRYEDLVAHPGRMHTGLAAFLDLPAGTGPAEEGEPVRDGNADYAMPADCAPEAARAMARWGYGPGGAVHPWTPPLQHPLRAVRERAAAALAAG